MTKSRIVELKPGELINRCDPKIFKIKTTEDIKEEELVVDQQRALDAIDFGIEIKSQGYNIYVAGITGTGRNTTILKEVNEVAVKEPVPDDICYLFNFDQNDEPKVLKLPAGTGCRFRDDMDEFVKDVESEIHKAFSSEEYEKNKKEVVEDIKQERNKLSAELEKEAREKGFTIQQTLTGLAVVPLKDERPMREKDFDRLSEDEKTELEKKQNEIYEKIYDYSKKIKAAQKQTRAEIEELDKRIALYAIEHLIDDLKKKYKDNDMITRHLDKIVGDILENLDYFKKDGQQQIPFINMGDQKQNILKKYKVNLLVDHYSSEGAPVVVEDNPSYPNLIGKVEYEAQLGVLSTDFTMIKPGAVHKANGGYLIIQAMDLFRDYYAWDALKRIIKHKKAKIESLHERYGLIQTKTLKPEPAEVDLKVIIVGHPFIYHLLYIYDPDFKKLFKVKADFDTTIKRDEDSIIHYAKFIAEIVKKEKLLPFDSEAVARLVDYGSRRCSHKEKMTARFLDIADMLREANYWAGKDKADVVEGRHVVKALEEKEYRSNMIEQKLQEMIMENTIYINTEGSEVGQINGLSVIDLGDYMFGKPSRITARTYIGKGKVINIERETEMSGRIHSKGVLILNGYIAEKFGQNKPLSLSASICFEQLYEEVDGDSASAAELYCLFSSLSGLPLRQDIAVTGSINQIGEVQPIGGVNQKIEGFYQTCRLNGLTGQQGVIIPHSNVKHLMLREEVVEAVKEKKFHIYPVKTVEEAIEILTGVPAGERNEKGEFPEGTVFSKIERKLERMGRNASMYREKGGAPLQQEKELAGSEVKSKKLTKK